MLIGGMNRHHIVAITRLGAHNLDGALPEGTSYPVAGFSFLCQGIAPAQRKSRRLICQGTESWASAQGGGLVLQSVCRWPGLSGRWKNGTNGGMSSNALY